MVVINFMNADNVIDFAYWGLVTLQAWVRMEQTDIWLETEPAMSSRRRGTSRGSEKSRSVGVARFGKRRRNARKPNSTT